MAQRLPTPIGRLSQAMFVLGICAAIVVGYINARHFPVFNQMEEHLLAARFMLRGPAEANKNIKIIVLEEGEAESPSALLGTLTTVVDRLNESGANVIVFDQSLMAKLETSGLFASTSVFSNALRSTLSRSENIRIAYKFSQKSGNFTDLPEAISDTAYRVYRFRDDMPPKLAVNPKSIMAPPAEILSAAVPGHETFFEVGTKYRQYAYPVVRYKGEFLPSLAIEATVAYLGMELTDVSVNFGSGLRIDSSYIPTDSMMQMALNYKGPVGSYQYHTVSEVVDGALPIDKFSDSLVLLSVVTSDPSSTSFTPFDAKLPNIEVLATAIDNLLIADPLDRSQQVIILDVILIALIGIFFGFMATLRSATVVLVLGLLVGGLVAILAFKAFTLLNLWLNLTFPTGTIILCILYLVAVKTISKKREWAIIEAEKNDTSKYAAPWIAERVRKAKDVIAAEEAAADEKAAPKATEKEIFEEELLLADEVIDKDGPDVMEESDSVVIVNEEPLFLEKPALAEKKKTTDDLKCTPDPIDLPASAGEPFAEMKKKDKKPEKAEIIVAAEVIEPIDVVEVITAVEVIEPEDVVEVIDAAKVIEPEKIDDHIEPDKNAVYRKVARVKEGTPASEDVKITNASENTAPNEPDKYSESSVASSLQFNVALLFVDMTGHAAADSILGPNRLAQIQQSWQEIVQATVNRHAGYADSFDDNGVIALFGLPDKNPNDCLNALRCVRELDKEFTAWQADQSLPDTVVLQFGIGMHYGKIDIEEIGGGSDGQLSITGDAISVVTHLENMSIAHSKAVIASDTIVDEVLLVGTSNELLNGFKPLPLQDVQSNGKTQRVWQWDGAG
jgi:class 3 adenylate cyclase/CHASE2 domain-containing sensor protein